MISRLYLAQISQSTKDDFPQVTIRDVVSLPTPNLDFCNPADVAKHDKIVSLVDRMLDMHKQLPKIRTPHEKEALQRRIDATDAQIDKLVYELYGLTEKEIGIVEAGK